MNADVDPGPARGILWKAPTPDATYHVRRAPPASLRAFVQHFWIVRWDLRGHPPQVQETLPHPNVYLIFEEGRACVFGVHTARYSRVLEEKGFAFGVKFRPGGFRPWLGRAVASIADRSIAPTDVFADAVDLDERLAAVADNDDALIDAAAAFLEPRRPPCDPLVERAVERVAAIVGEIASDVSIARVEQLAERHAMTPRALQRLFRDYVGASPKWVIARYRLHEAVERIGRGEAIDWSTLALDLGYFDQAHFIRDFKRLVGWAPAEYARRARVPRV